MTNLPDRGVGWSSADAAIVIGKVDQPCIIAIENYS